MKEILKSVIFVILSLVSSALLAQPSNDECQFAKFLPNVSDYCSSPAEFTNVGATADPPFSPQLYIAQICQWCLV